MIARALVLTAACSAAAGCIPREIEETGPVIGFQISRSGFSTLDEDSTMMRIDPDTMSYEFTFTLQTRAGREKTGPDSKYRPVTEFTATFTTPSVTVEGGDYTRSTSELDPSFERDEVVTIPGTDRGQNLLIHVEATDSGGLRSNILDVTYLLD